jgi:hypothetical protein
LQKLDGKKMAAVAQRTKGSAGSKKPNANASKTPIPLAERPFSGKMEFCSEPDLSSMSASRALSAKSKMRSMSMSNLAQLAVKQNVTSKSTTPKYHHAKPSTCKDNHGRVHGDNGTLEVRLRDKRKITQALRPDSYSNYEKLNPFKRSFVREWKESHDKK